MYRHTVCTSLYVCVMANKIMLIVCLQEYGRGCATLVGDAAHVGPVNGQGLNLTMEDAAVLGFHLREGGLNAESLRRRARPTTHESLLVCVCPLHSLSHPRRNASANEPVCAGAFALLFLLLYVNTGDNADSEIVFVGEGLQFLGCPAHTRTHIHTYLVSCSLFRQFPAFV
jgi:hypothetical protein